MIPVKEKGRSGSDEPKEIEYWRSDTVWPRSLYPLWIGAGLRADIGILLQPVMNQTGLAYDDVSFCIALMQLVFGVSQPVFGLIAGALLSGFLSTRISKGKLLTWKR